MRSPSGMRGIFCAGRNSLEVGVYMYKINQFTEDDLEFYQLQDLSAGSNVVVCPERGGIILTFTCNGEELLYLNEATVRNREANIRGGIPVLFPICGQLMNDEYVLNGQLYKMKNHGFARIYPWEVVESCTDDGAAITLRFTSNETTKEIYPYDFELLFEYKLKGSELTIQQNYHNRSSTAMPMYAGFHPYFNTNTKSVTYTVSVEKYLDYQGLEIKEFHGQYDFSNRNDAILLMDVKDQAVSFGMDANGEKRIHLSFGSEFKHIAIWSQAGEEYLCVEPWMGKMNDLNDVEQVRHVEPGGVLETEFRITFEGE
jgi:galactose mutarotase-like enzyme